MALASVLVAVTEVVVVVVEGVIVLEEIELIIVVGFDSSLMESGEVRLVEAVVAVVVVVAVAVVVAVVAVAKPVVVVAVNGSAKVAAEAGNGSVEASCWERVGVEEWGLKRGKGGVEGGRKERRGSSEQLRLQLHIGGTILTSQR